ncbi:MFS transporter [Clostridium sp. Sa3CUN1]|uniref:MFS transporter n=1 Tax=Clostridium gallinarum TaxID=2762246 RepID=A0ABR8Q379_9CLOT|nr:MFS transporter [Clostridium gallinarum]MBD7914878.1 MFS transporter [Clostridium gallinarum]
MNFTKKISLLSISFVLTTAYAISPGIPLMMRDFPNQSEMSIQMLTTIPALSVMIMVLISSLISKHIGSKTTVIIGLIFISIFGPLPVILNSFPVILLCRLLLGVGFGLVNPLAVSLISKFFNGDEKATLLGFRGAVESLGQSALTLVAGYLLTFGWRYSFLVYLVAIPILIFFMIFIPDISKEEKEVKQKAEIKNENGVRKNTLNLNVLMFASVLFFIILTYVGVKVKLSTLIVNKGYGTVVDAGQILSLLTFIGMFAAMCFGKFYKILKNNLLTLAIIVIGLGQIIVGYSNSLIMTYIGSILIGFFYPLVVAFIFNICSTISNENQVTLTTSIMLVGCNTGAFLAPYGLKLVNLIIRQDNPTLVFTIYGCVLFVIAIVIYYVLKNVQKKYKGSME